MGGHLLRDFELPTIFQIRRDASCAEGVAANQRLDSRAFQKFEINEEAKSIKEKSP
jgi:hypothetical protein